MSEAQWKTSVLKWQGCVFKTNFPFSREVLYELKYNPSLNASQNNTLEEIETLRL